MTALRCSVARWFVVALAGLLAGGSARAAVGDDTLPTQAEWISARPGTNAGTALFRRAFVAEPGLAKAVLLAAADRAAVIHVNGTNAAQVNGTALAATVDVTRLLRAGTNWLTVQVTNGGGLPAFRLMLELATGDGRQLWVVSDATWQASTQVVATWERPATAWPGARAATAHGDAGLARWGNPFKATRSVDAYNSWMLARGVERATDPATMSVRPGFRVELLRSALPEEDSWIALAFDPQGRVTIAREKRGLLRLTLGREAAEKVEVIEDTLLECRGLLYAHGSLFVNANNSRGFYRLRDADGDGVFEEKKLLLATPGGGVGHGRNQLRLGPDGLIYLVHGDDVPLPPNLATNSPVQQLANDMLMPTLDPRRPGRLIRYVQTGHVLQTDAEGSFFRLIAGGLRNPMDADFNGDGELFTFDSDMERDIGTPWYRPTRVLHVVPGGDYGWRRGPGNIPPHSPDTWPAAVDIGVSSPTSVAFGTRSKFPEKYRRALFLGDWAYGRILISHLQPQGASYTGTFEEFLSGRPLNLTDLEFGPDGALYFVTGGRGTKSGLYRVTWTGTELARPAAATNETTSAQARSARRRLEAGPGDQPAAAWLDELWPRLGEDDFWIRAAARNALERQPTALWSDRALAETNPVIAANALLALARSTGPETQSALLVRVSRLPWAQLDDPALLTALRTLGITLARQGWPGDELAGTLAKTLEPQFPAASRALNHELSRLLVFLRSPAVLAKALPLLAGAVQPDDRLHYLAQLWSLRDGWDLARRRTYFTALADAERDQGARDYYSALQSLRKNLTTTLSTAERLALGPLANPAPASALTVAAPATQIVQHWQLADFNLAAETGPRSPGKGREAFRLAGCVQCHRVGSEGGLVGPDLTSVSARFGRRDLLEHILDPSKAVDEKYRLALVTLKDGTELSGTVERDDEVLVLATAEPGAEDREIPRADIQERRWSDVSPMPTGLLDVLTKEQVLDLVAFLETARLGAD